MASDMQKETLKSKGAIRMVSDTQELVKERNILDNVMPDAQENPKLSEDNSRLSQGMIVGYDN